jgi:hypothetical protein
MLYEFIQFMNKRYRIPKRQSRMEHPEKLASLGTVDTGRRQTTLNTKQNTRNSNTAPQRVQMNFIFNDNVRILCLSCNVKKVGKLVRFKRKGEKQALR